MAFWCSFLAPVPITRQPNGHDIWDAPPTTSTRHPRWTPRPANLFDPRSNVIDTTTESLSQRTEPLHRNATNFLGSRNQPTVSTPYPTHWPTSLFTTFTSDSVNNEEDNTTLTQHNLPPSTDNSNMERLQTMNATDIAAFLRGNLAQNDGSQVDDSQEDDLTMAPRPATPLGSNGDHPLH
ncbi:hypothetical protein NDA18_002492 [Ustilago nuda]|nr:hypothetical protein NDA18_002492 [Ustilago nuda]